MMLTGVHMKQVVLFVFLLCFPAVWAQECIKVACVGNSITYGSGLPERMTQSYPVLLQQLLGDKYEVGNFGKPGATLLKQGHRPYTEQEEYRQAMAFAGDIVVIHLGINDTDPRNWPNYRDFFVQDYLHLIDTFRKANPNARVLIARMTPIADRHSRFLSGTRDWHGEIQVAIETVAQYAGVQLVDFHEPLYPYPFMLPDAVHPSPEGTKKIAETVYSAITGDYGGLKVSPLYTDDMVLQRDVDLTIRGIANAGEQVTVRVERQSKTTKSGFANVGKQAALNSIDPQQATKTGTDGKWEVHLLPFEAGGPYTLTISTPKRTLRFKNVLFGEVWLCSGQSNMEFMLKQAATGKRDIPHVADEQLRFFDMKARWRTDAVEWDASVLDSLNGLHYFAGTQWEACTPESAADFSAIAYYFGKMLRDSLQVPVGLVCNAIGGSPTEAWVDRRTLEYRFPALLKDWMKNDFIQDWVRERAALNTGMSENKFQRHPYEPCYLFEAGIRPLQSYPIKGVLWYQGESNAHNKEAHEQLFGLLVDSWRTYWRNKQMPFYYVQLSSLNRPSWSWFRDSQRAMMNEIPHVGMVVSSDWGDSLDVHPVNKEPIGKRLTYWALHQTYGYPDIIPSGPLFRNADFQADTVFVSFDYGQGLTSSDGDVLRTFEVAETDGLYYPAQAEVQMDGRLKIHSEKVTNPRYVRYGWQPYTRANLVNSAGLPASTFCAKTKNKMNNMKWTKLPDLPGAAGMASLGVSAPFTAIWNDLLVVAGGCNFPDKPVTKGGVKRYYDEVFALDLQEKKAGWKMIGHLPEPVGYGATAVTSRGIVCIGGNDDKTSFSKALLLIPEKENFRVTLLPALPVAMDNMAAAAIGDVVYVAGGNTNGIPSNKLYSLDLCNLEKGWESLPGFPGAQRVQPILVAQKKTGNAGGFHTAGTRSLQTDPIFRTDPEVIGETCLFLAGGFQPATGEEAAQVPTGMLMYSPSEKQWMQVSVIPSFADGSLRTLTGAAGVAYGDSLILFAGGVNYDCFLSAVDRPRQIEIAKRKGDKETLELLQKEASEYLLHPTEWYRFNQSLLIYHTKTGRWTETDAYEPFARAGAGFVVHKDQLIVVNGELKPGVRTPEVNSLEGVKSYLSHQ